MKIIPALIFVSLLSFLSMSVTAQDDNIKVETEIVSVNVALADEKGRPVTGLPQSAFQVFDNGRAQKIEYFSSMSAGVTYGIVYDMHPTTDQRTAAVLNGLREFTKGLPSADDVFMVVFNERGSLSLDFVPDAEQLRRHLANPEKRQPRSLYDALYMAAQKLRQTKNLKRTLLVITDAADHSSLRTFNELRDELKKFDVQVYAIMLDETIGRFETYIDITKGTSERQLLSDASASDRAALNSITLRSGGATFPASLEDQERILRITRQIAEEVRNQYTLSFYPADPTDGKWHTLRVGLRNVPGSKNFVLRYRPGYQMTSATRRP